MDQEQLDRFYMQQALRLAEKAAQLGEVPVGALLVMDGEVIGEGWNRPISGHDPTAHAEIMALREAAARVGNYRLVGATLYVTIEPCTMCAGALVHARVARVVFGTTEPKAGAVVSNQQLFDQPWVNHRPEHEGGVLEGACASVISEFFRLRRDEQKRQKRLRREAAGD
ncbi:tRNA adenosine(34) deaminase TadA [Marinobacterium sediminicola]|uniref:tRNA-specific adenosine deaminase n=1 Tax=Marinobacterium sediminicola TaxID=518898 RepID=A0ABY1RZV5_9GAMM|nr:tRNA adenosine(34) deaminase TadA [Marinobacterium sediminicola]ULG70013.1 tRNA adenosine(34) deaminase TadA [Marinobacterium sediminicola]SMR74467.1 tRNA(Arg) A34 adenosine deaminase TadA [Marinobacterium sediminicola]